MEQNYVTVTLCIELGFRRFRVTGGVRRDQSGTMFENT